MTKHALGAAHADLMGVEFDNFDAEREEITLRFTAPDSFITPRGSVQGGSFSSSEDRERRRTGRVGFSGAEQSAYSCECLRSQVGTCK